MGRILGIDYGKRRVGIATTDPLKLIVTGLGTIPETDFKDFIDRYMEAEDVEKIVFGKSWHADGTPTEVSKAVDKLIVKLKKDYPDLETDTIDEAYTSHRAREVILKSGLKRKKRRDKGLVDKVSAMLILQEYLGFI